MTVEEKQRQTARPQKPSDEGKPAVIAPGATFHGITSQITSIVLRKSVPPFWVWAFACGIAALFMFVGAVGYLLAAGVGLFGINIPVAWGFAITNFVWWIGIGHAGTLISAILLLLNQSWRNSINRFAEAMTIFAVACAGMFPLLHLGRPWLFFWLLPYPNTFVIQPQFRSPLVWDVFAVSTYATVSLLFWYLGMIPDFASIRDRAVSRVSYWTYGILSFGWRGASRHWRLHETASVLLAGLATPLVLSVHTVVSFDFTIAILPGWHSTIFPPYFVAGAIFSGFAMVLVLAIPIRSAYGLKNLITERHLDNCAKLMLATGLVLAYTYAIEPFTSWYSGNTYEMYVVHARAVGPYAWSYWAVIMMNVIVPQLLWWKSNRTHTVRLFLISMDVLIGMWLERYMIIVGSLNRDFLPSSWERFVATAVDNAILYGSVGLFVVLFFLFLRTLPMISMYEVRELLPFSRPGGGTVK
ncbi:MAG TPA: NrfD/PsrC family molybdoenzyme membrane anchor subunit [Terriglobia bacterium]|nr:NrfD/PsrC family molybdoenzyme membrane anchor subunit [Terriglobia bacterium]